MALSDDQVREVLGAYANLGPQPIPETSLPGLPELRRGRRRPERRPPTQVTLVDRNGLAVWEWGFVKRKRLGIVDRARRAAGPGAASGRQIFSRILEPLGVNQIGLMLLDFDCERNPAVDRKAGWKLRQWYEDQQTLGEAVPVKAKNLLLIIHGTASCGDHIIGEIKQSEAGGRLLADAAKHYSAVLSFEHPTLSMNPLLNALDLSVALEPFGNCAVDIVCHSRGGLVASWWMHVVDTQRRNKRCVFVGSPLHGTNLANPAKLRSSLHLLANYGRLLSNVGIASGFLALPMTIIKVASSVVDFTAKTPLLDAALAMIPGLGAQSATENNQELIRLHARKSFNPTVPSHFCIRANYASKNEGWKFWRYFTDDPKLRLIDAAVDTFVFPGENDLVVDTNSMLDVADSPEFKLPSDEVHHTNYFEQKQTVEKIREWLAIPSAAAASGH